MGPFDGPEAFLRSGRENIELARRLIGLSAGHRVLDIGCGCGRVALHLARFLSADGAYEGFDADAIYVEWCRENIQRHDSRFTFVHMDVESAVYNPRGRVPPGAVTFPYPDDTFDSVLVSSVFTHMPESGVQRYVAEVGRVLRPSGQVLISALLMNTATEAAVRDETTRFAFHHRLGPWSWTNDATATCEAVSQSETWLLKTLADHGLSVTSIEYGDWRRRNSWAVQHDWIAAQRVSPRHQE